MLRLVVCRGSRGHAQGQRVSQSSRLPGDKGVRSPSPFHGDQTVTNPSSRTFAFARTVVIAHRSNMIAEGIAAALERYTEIVPVALATTAAEAERLGRRADAVAID